MQRDHDVHFRGSYSISPCSASFFRLLDDPTAKYVDDVLPNQLIVVHFFFRMFREKYGSVLDTTQYQFFGGKRMESAYLYLAID
jgi:hypothetical protein